VAADIAILAFGAITVLLSLQLPIGSLHAPGSGLFPAVLGVILIGLAGCHLVLQRRTPAAPAEPQSDSGGRLRVILFFGAIAAATALLSILGFPAVAFLLMLALLEVLGMRRRRDSLLIALITAVGAYALFVGWLKIPLPRGWLGL